MLEKKVAMSSKFFITINKYKIGSRYKKRHLLIIDIATKMDSRKEALPEVQLMIDEFVNKLPNK